MNSEMLEEILACPSLPSLPMVALRVIELCSDPNVKIPELAKTIQNDQALSAKVLRTVNSSFYGLRERCGNINKALVMLGLSPVKALVLGFSLVSSVEIREGDGFDYQDYWRRGMFTAVGAKCLVEAAGKKYGDEAFIAGLLQDIGVMAMYRALGEEYLAVLKSTGGDHRKLVRAELSSFEVQHPDIGAMLAQRWKLPDALVLPVKYHERPTAAPNQHVEIVQAVGLGNLVHDVILGTETQDSLRKLYAKADQWLGLKSDVVDSSLERARSATKAMADLFRLDIGVAGETEAIERKAESELAKVGAEATPTGGGTIELLLIDPADINPATGLMGRKGFDWGLRRAYRVAKEDGDTASLLNIVADVPSLTPDSEAGKPVLAVLSAALRKQFTSLGAAICHLGGWIFTVTIAGSSTTEINRAADDFRKAASKLCTDSGHGVGISIGVVHFGAELATGFADASSIVRAAASATQAARTAGGNCVKVYESSAGASGAKAA